jgi:hypothetical protein
MRVALWTFAILFSFTMLAQADDVGKFKNQKQIRIPVLERNGYTARGGIDETQIWNTPDIYGRAPSWLDNSSRPAGLTISRPF